MPGQDRNNALYVPTGAAMFRLEDNYSQFRDEVDGVYLRLKPDADILAAAATVRGILAASHRGADDYTLVVPAELLAEQQRTKRIFDIVMVALASISLLVGGIGIMNIMLASVLERTREIGVRRAIGARRTDIIRQFVMETTLIAVAGGTIGLLVGASMSRLIASFAGWSTIISGGVAGAGVLRVDGDRPRFGRLPGDESRRPGPGPGASLRVAAGWPAGPRRKTKKGKLCPVIFRRIPWSAD